MGWMFVLLVLLIVAVGLGIVFTLSRRGRHERNPDDKATTTIYDEGTPSDIPSRQQP
jgi:hypothetical protein